MDPWAEVPSTAVGAACMGHGEVCSPDSRPPLSTAQLAEVPVVDLSLTGSEPRTLCTSYQGKAEGPPERGPAAGKREQGPFRI